MEEPIEAVPSSLTVRISIPFEHPISMIRVIKQISHLDLPEAMKAHERLVERAFTSQPWGQLALHASENRDEAVAALEALGLEVRVAASGDFGRHGVAGPVRTVRAGESLASAVCEIADELARGVEVAADALHEWEHAFDDDRPVDRANWECVSRYLRIAGTQVSRDLDDRSRSGDSRCEVAPYLHLRFAIDVGGSEVRDDCFAELPAPPGHSGGLYDFLAPAVPVLPTLSVALEQVLGRRSERWRSDPRLHAAFTSIADCDNRLLRDAYLSLPLEFGPVFGIELAVNARDLSGAERRRPIHVGVALRVDIELPDLALGRVFRLNVELAATET